MSQIIASGSELPVATSVLSGEKLAQLILCKWPFNVISFPVFKLKMMASDNLHVIIIVESGEKITPWTGRE